MRVTRAYAAVFLSLLIPVSLGAQQASPPTISAAMLLQQSLAAQIGNTSISDVTVTGTARRIAGSDDETGTATLKAASSGNTRVDFVFPSGPGGEVRTNPTTASAGSWYGADRIARPVAYHNLIVDSSWFFTPFALGRFLGSSNYSISSATQETKDGQAVLHITVVQQFPNLSPEIAARMRHLSQMDLFLDASTLLPVALAYAIHPDNDMGLDIPIEIRYSDYRTVNGVRIPFRVQKYLNNGLALDLQLQSVSINSGLSANDFSL